MYVYTYRHDLDYKGLNVSLGPLARCPFSDSSNERPLIKKVNCSFSHLSSYLLLASKGLLTVGNMTCLIALLTGPVVLSNGPDKESIG